MNARQRRKQRRALRSKNAFWLNQQRMTSDAIEAALVSLFLERFKTR